MNHLIKLKQWRWKSKGDVFNSGPKFKKWRWWGCNDLKQQQHLQQQQNRKDHQRAVTGHAISWFVWYLSCLFMSFCEMESPCVFKCLEGINM